MSCLFCSIAQHNIPSEIVYEDDATSAFLDIQPRSLGHTVVVSKTHAETIIDLPAASLAPLFLTLQHVTGMLSRALHPAGFTIGINQGLVSGQTVPHLHVHIIPRFTGDGGGSIHSVVNQPPNEAIAMTAARIRKYS